MAKLYEYMYTVRYCKLTCEPCDLGGRCDECEHAYEQSQINEIAKNLEEENSR